jgi:hypothetical protein
MPLLAFQLLRLVHIFAGVFWAGGVFVVAGWLAPTIKALGPAAGPFVQHLTGARRLPAALLWSAAFTVLSGLVLYWRDAAGFQGPWAGSASGLVFGLGAVCGIAGGALGFLINSPTAVQLGAMAAAVQRSGAPPTAEQRAEMERLQARLDWATPLGAWLLALSVAAMAVGRLAA